jgi:hypothetical protein
MKKFFFLGLVISVIVSCKKPPVDPVEVCQTDAASIIGSYKIIACTYKGGPQFPEINYMYTLFPDSCDRDDIYRFNANDSYQIMDIGLVCPISNDYAGTWKFISSTSLAIDGDPIILESFDCTTLVIVNTDTQQPGDRLKLTMRKQ